MTLKGIVPCSLTTTNLVVRPVVISPESIQSIRKDIESTFGQQKKRFRILKKY